MGLSKAGPDDFVSNPQRVQRPPESKELAWLVALATLATIGLCGGLVLVRLFG